MKVVGTTVRHGRAISIFPAVFRTLENGFFIGPIDKSACPMNSRHFPDPVRAPGANALPEPPLLEVKGLRMAYGSGPDSLSVLGDVHLRLDRGEFIALIGPSGCGKSTFFNLLAGLVQPNGGEIRLQGGPVADLRGAIAYMQQKDLLLPWRKTLDNAVLGLEIQGVPRPTARKRARDLLTVFGLKGFEDRYPHELSGGMRQRVALMRTILCGKDIWLLDEPFGALDAITRREMQTWLLKAWERYGASVLLVTHDVEEALVLADRVYVMTARPSRIRASLAVPLARPRPVTQADMVRLKADLLGLLESGPEEKP
jgi:ABC-type nitrate/sulfonate/bicarbonate transport system ATPase subunit